MFLMDKNMKENRIIIIGEKSYIFLCLICSLLIDANANDFNVKICCKILINLCNLTICIYHLLISYVKSLTYFYYDTFIKHKSISYENSWIKEIAFAKEPFLIFWLQFDNFYLSFYQVIPYLMLELISNILLAFF